MNEDLKSRLASYYELPPAEQQITRELVLAMANADPTAFIQLIHQQKFETVADELANNLPVFYEALAADLSNWDDFFVQEAQRLFTLARTTTVPQKVLTHLDEFCFITATEFKNRDTLVALLSKELESTTLACRYYAARCIVPGCDGVPFGRANQQKLWDRYFTAAPVQLRQYDAVSSVVRKASKR